MMTSVLVAFVSAISLLAITSLILSKQRKNLRRVEQAFAFHRLRDELQQLAIEGQIPTESETFRVLMMLLNLSIKNAGVLKLRNVLKLVKSVEGKIGESGQERFRHDLATRPLAVQSLAAKCFFSLAQMLCCNDDLLLILVARVRLILPFTVKKILRHVIKELSPMRAEALNESRKFNRFAQGLSHCS